MLRNNTAYINFLIPIICVGSLIFFFQNCEEMQEVSNSPNPPIERVNNLGKLVDSAEETKQIIINHNRILDGNHLGGSLVFDFDDLMLAEYKDKVLSGENPTIFHCDKELDRANQDLLELKSLIKSADICHYQVELDPDRICSLVMVPGAIIHRSEAEDIAINQHHNGCGTDHYNFCDLDVREAVNQAREDVLANPDLRCSDD